MNFGSDGVRALMAAAALTVALSLGGCETDGTGPSERSLKPLSPEMVSELEHRNMPKESPILIRLYKEESEVEVWKQDTSGRFAMLKTYPICRWSGELGPKTKEGDRQAPEGFYTITPSQMNPNSHYYLSFNIGYPNAYDRAHNYTGSNLMVHGDCSSRGCYAMTDEQISEIYALARESFFGGQQSFQVQAFPFRMTPLNMARHRNNPNMAFWKMLKEGHDHFEVTRLEPKVDVCEKRYVFDAEAPADATRPGATTTPALTFNPTGRCPAYQVQQDLAVGVADKARRDDIQTAELVRSGTPMAPVRTGTDGGMHAVFLAKLKPYEIRDADGSVRAIVDTSAPGTVPPTVNPPHAPDPVVAEAPPAAAAPVPRPAPPLSRVASTVPARAESAGSNGNMFTRLFSSDGPQESGLSRVTSSVSRLFGAGEDKKPDPAPVATTPVPVPKPAAITRPTAAHAAPVAKPKPPAQPDDASPPVRTSSATSGSNVITGAQPVVPAGSFDSRWSGLR